MNKKIYRTWMLLRKNIPERRYYSIVAIIFLTGLLEMVGLGVIFPLLKILSEPDLINLYSNYLNFFSPENFVPWLLILIIMFYGLKALFLSYGTYKIFDTVFFLQAELSNKLFRGLLISDYDDHRNLNVNKESSILVNDIPLVCMEWFLPCIYILSDLVTLLIIVICLGFLNITILLVTGLVGLLVFGSTLIFSRIYSFKWGSSRKVYDDLKINYFNNALIHIKEIITYNKKTFYYAKFSEANRAASRSGNLQSTAQVIPKFFIEFVAICILVSIIFIMIITGEDLKHIIPTVGVYSVAAFRIIPSINRLVQSVQMLQYGAESARVVLNAIKRDCDDSCIFELSKSKKKLIFKCLKIDHLTYQYPNSKTEVLKDLSLDIIEGDFVAIVGESGSGKSTLIDIILGLNKTKKGSLEVNHRPFIEHIHEWRNTIGYVPQNTHLTSGSLIENITFDDHEDDIDYDLLNHVIEVTGIRKSLGPDLNIFVGERGLKISGGQRQRIAIARALYKKPSILILDEATSALDRDSENQILDAIKKEFKEISMIFITHHLYNSKTFHKLYKLENGSLSLVNN